MAITATEIHNKFLNGETVELVEPADYNTLVLYLKEHPNPEDGIDDDKKMRKVVVTSDLDFNGINCEPSNFNVTYLDFSGGGCEFKNIVATFSGGVFFIGHDNNSTQYNGIGTTYVSNIIINNCYLSSTDTLNVFGSAELDSIYIHHCRFTANNIVRIFYIRRRSIKNCACSATIVAPNGYYGVEVYEPDSSEAASFVSLCNKVYITANGNGFSFYGTYMDGVTLAHNCYSRDIFYAPNKTSGWIIVYYNDGNYNGGKIINCYYAGIIDNNNDAVTKSVNFQDNNYANSSAIYPISSYYDKTIWNNQTDGSYPPSSAAWRLHHFTGITTEELQNESYLTYNGWFISSSSS